MTKAADSVSLNLLGHTYQIKCPKNEQDTLLKSAEYLEAKMREVQGKTKGMPFDRVILLASLNIIHELLTNDGQKNSNLTMITERIRELQNKIEYALTPTEQMEL